MTNAYQSLQGLPGFGGGTPQPLQGLPGFAPAAPQAVQQPGGPVALPPALQGTGVAQFDAARPVSDVGALETVGVQAGRGFMDALLGTGALVGAGAQSLGNVTGWKGLEDFGQDLGKSSSGTAAAEAASFLFGGGGKKGLSYAEKTSNAIAEQEQAWPMLTTVSRIGGGVGLALATGGLSGASGGVGATLGGTIGIGAYEGAAGGVQQAYAQNESLRDVLVSGLTGAVFGGAAGGLVHGAAGLPGRIGKAIDDRNMLRQVFGDVKTAADDVATAVRDAGGREMYDAAKAVLKERADVLRQVTAAGDNPSVIRQVYVKAARAAGENLSKLAGDFDPATWATKTPSPIQKLLHRTPLLDRVSEDLAGDAAKLTAARPSIDFELKVPGKLLADADKTAAIAGLQSRVTQAIEQMPDERMRALLLPFSEKLAKADAAESMALGHDLVKQFTGLSQSADVDAITAAYAKRQAGAMADELGGDAWGSAGKAYKAATRLDGPLDQLDAKQLREALKHADSEKAIPSLFAEQGDQVTAAYAARKQLGGEYADQPTRKLIRDAGERADKAHDAVTFDGAPARRVLDVLSGAGRNIGESYASDLLGMGVGMAVGGVPGMLVARALSPILGEVASAAFGKGVAKAGARAGRSFAAEALGAARSATGNAAKGSLTWQQYSYHDSVSKLADMISQASPDVVEHQQRALASLPPEIQAQAGTDMQSKLTQLMADIPKPTPNIRGKAWETLSSGDLRKAQSMWEATMQPMSVFQDFTRGNIDYDKVRYAWKQYPGLQQAAQAGLIDVIHAQLDDKQRSTISDGMLTQLDNLFGFDGALQPTLDHGFAARMSALAQPEQPSPKPQSSGPLKLPTSQPSYTERIAGARA